MGKDIVKLNYYSIARLNSDLIHHFLPKMPEGINLIVAIPRDGILVASLISLYRQIPFTDLVSFCEGRIYRPGAKHRVKENYNTEVGSILLVDDICATGAAMKEAKAEISALKLNIKIYNSSLYVLRGEGKVKAGLIDFYGQEIKLPGHYEWTQCDMFRSTKTIYDFDGVLCPNYAGHADDDNDKYREFLRNAPLKLKPKEIGAIVTWRPEKYRSIVEEWLQRHNITYQKLIMADRDKWKNPIEFKAHHYKLLPFNLFIESSTRQASEIQKLANKPVISLETQEIFQ